MEVSDPSDVLKPAIDAVAEKLIADGLLDKQEWAKAFWKSTDEKFMEQVGATEAPEAPQISPSHFP